MGDVGHVDEDGFVFLSDRAANMIISGGVNIYPAEIEQELIDHPAVADVAVFGIPDDEWGEQVKAAVELAAGLRAVRRAGGRACSPFARTRAGRVQGAAVDRLRGRSCPATRPGKLYTRLLRAKYWEGRDVDRAVVKVTGRDSRPLTKLAGRSSSSASGSAMAQVGEAIEELVEHHGDLEAGQAGAEAEVRAEAERHVLVGRALHVEAERVVEHVLVAVGRRVEQHQLVALADLLAAAARRRGWRCGPCS